MGKIHSLSPGYIAELNEMLLWWRLHKNDAAPEPAETPASNPPDLAVMLLESLTSGGTARATILQGDASRNHYIVTGYGLREDTAKFSLTWQASPSGGSETVTGISINASPEELTEKLLELSFISSADIKVTNGNHVRVLGEGDNETLTEFNTYRWIIEAKNQMIAAPVPTVVSESGVQSWMGAESTIAFDTGRVIEVRSLLPVGLNSENSSPLQSGAFGILSYLRTFGYTFNAIEARNLSAFFEGEVLY